MKTIDFPVRGLYFLAWLASLFFVLSGCEQDQSQPDQPFSELFWVSNKGSEMPVFVTGNYQSDFIVLFVHGGPGQCMIAETGIYTLDPTANLSDDYLLAMWDQRYAGYSINPEVVDWSTVNVEQYAEDCARVTDRLKVKFPGKKIIVCGHSWGGAVVTAFITNPAYQHSYDGWIVADGMVNGYDLANAWVGYSRRRCNELIENGFTQYSDTLNYLNSVVFDPMILDKPAYFRVQALAISLRVPGEQPIAQEDLDQWSQLEKSIFPDSTAQNRKNQNAISQANFDLFENKIYFINHNNLYRNISKPGLIVWGENDYIVPVEASAPFTSKLDSLGIPFIFKRYPDCWHTPVISNRSQYFDDIKGYINSL